MRKVRMIWMTKGKMRIRSGRGGSGRSKEVKAEER